MFLEISQNSQENTCARVSFLIKLKVCNFIKKETLAQAFFCEFFKISKNTFFTEHLRTATSKTWNQNLDLEKPGLRKTWTLKTLDYEKRGKHLDAEK